jgi:hypothetical protein
MLAGKANLEGVEFSVYAVAAIWGFTAEKHAIVSDLNN